MFPRKTLILIALLASAPMALAQDNPFKFGTDASAPDDSVMEDFRVGFEEADQALQDAISDSKSLKPEASFKITSQAAINYFLKVGFKRKRKVSVLLMNSSLLLAYGTPSASGDRIVAPALLTSQLNPDLRALILRESLQMALDLARRSDQKKSWVNLDYEDAAVLRVSRGLVWAQSALIEESRYQILRDLLTQWSNLLTKTDFQYPERWSRLLVNANDRLRECPVTAPGGEDQTLCIAHLGDLLHSILQGAPGGGVAEVPYETYGELSRAYFGALTVTDQINDLATSLRLLSTPVLPAGSPNRVIMSQKCWNLTRGLINRRNELKDEHRAALRNMLTDNTSYDLNLHAAYILAIVGTDNDREAIAERGNSFVGSSQKLQFSRIARNPNEVLSLLEMNQ